MSDFVVSVLEVLLLMPPAINTIHRWLHFIKLLFTVENKVSAGMSFCCLCTVDWCYVMLESVLGKKKNILKRLRLSHLKASLWSSFPSRSTVELFFNE